MSDTEIGIVQDLLEGIPSQPDFVDSLDAPKHDRDISPEDTFLSFPSDSPKPAYSTPTVSNVAPSIPFQQSAYQQQLEQMNKQHQSQKAKLSSSSSVDNVYSDLPTQSYQQSYLTPQQQQQQQHYQTQQSTLSSSYSQLPLTSSSSQLYSQPQQSQTTYLQAQQLPLSSPSTLSSSTSYSQLPLSSPSQVYPQQSQQSASYVPVQQQSSASYPGAQQLPLPSSSSSQSTGQSYSQPSYSTQQTSNSNYAGAQQLPLAPSGSYNAQQGSYGQGSNYPSQYATSNQSQQSAPLQQNPSLSSQTYPGASASSSAYTQQTGYLPLQPRDMSSSRGDMSYQQQNYQQQPTYSESNNLSNTSRSSQSYNNNNNNQAYSTNYYSNNTNNTNNNISNNSNGSNGYSTNSNGYAPSPSSSSTYYPPNQYPNATQLLAQQQNSSTSYTMNNSNIMNNQDGLKIPMNRGQKEILPRGKVGLLQRVLENPRQSGLIPRFNPTDPSFNDIYWSGQGQSQGQGQAQTGLPYNNMMPYNTSMIYPNPSNYVRNNNRPKPNNNRSSSYQRNTNRNRYVSRREDTFDSEDDEFIDNRNVNEMSEHSRSDDTFSEDGEVRESSITTRKRRRDNNLELFNEDNSDSSIHIIESDFGDEKLRPVTRSRVGSSDRKQKRHHMLYDANDSEEEEEDDESVQDTDDNAGSLSDDDESGEGGENNKNHNNENDTVSPKKKISQLQKLISVCETKVDKLTEILAQNGLEYEKLKQTAVAITLPLAIGQPALLSDHCKLTQYQLVGLNWLYLLYQANLNGILADEMGLGKTLQTISMFALLKEKNICSGPHLVVVPSSTLTQWYNEIQHWCPTLKTVTYYGTLTERKEIRNQCKDYEQFDVLLTTYQLVGGKSDKKLFKNIPWHYLVLDEAQNIKNGSSLRFQALFKIKSKNKLLLTGTPLQNNLQELWALLHFLMSDEFERLKIENYAEVFRDFIKNNNEGTKKKKKNESERKR